MNNDRYIAFVYYADSVFMVQFGDGRNSNVVLCLSCCFRLHHVVWHVLTCSVPFRVWYVSYVVHGVVCVDCAVCVSVYVYLVCRMCVYMSVSVFMLVSGPFVYVSICVYL